jgi:hypothetical protein
VTPQEKQLARVIFKNKVLQAKGTAYEDLFAQVMQYSRLGFLKIKPYGNQGDRGNDGYEKEHGRYFQVFSPALPSTSVKKAIQKAENDFKDKLLPYWNTLCEIKEYYFVFNDKYDGTIRDIQESLENLKKNYKLVDACVYLSKHLEDECLNLEEDKILVIVNGIPHLESTTGIDFSVLREVVEYIQNMQPELSSEANFKVPDIDKKIKFNGLDVCSHWLKAKQLETWQLEEYFSRNSEYAKQCLREHLAGYYAESLKEYPDSYASNGNKSLGDLRFVYVLDRITPSTGNPAYKRLTRDAALIIMAKYFETCDIFKEPL